MKFINDIYKNKNLFVDIKKIGYGGHNKYIDEIGNSFYIKDIGIIQIKCNDCCLKTDVVFKKRYLKNKYYCQSCNKKGNKNPFYGKHHSNENKKKIGGNVHDYGGKNNPMYGKSVYDVWVKKYGIDEANHRLKIQGKKTSEKNSGKNNAMYGRSVYDVWVEKYGKLIADNKLEIMRNKIQKYQNKPEIKEKKRNRILKWMEDGKVLEKLFLKKL